MVIVLGTRPDQIIAYQGAGTGPCYPSNAPYAHTQVQL